jgi:hypothetical protein
VKAMGLWPKHLGNVDFFLNKRNSTYIFYRIGLFQ